MMRRDDLRRLFDYHYWATHELLAVVAPLTPDEFTRDVAGSYGSVRNTLVHVMSAEWGWIDRCGGTPRGERLQAERYPTPESLVEEWTRVEGYARDFLAAVSEEQLAGEVEFRFGGPPRSLPRRELLLHCIVHAVHHRGQVSLLLRELGKVPGNFDLLYWPGASDERR
jgi:uncharacterized damage-inducible protein DinB